MSSDGSIGAAGSAREGEGRFAFLDQALWRQFLEARSPEDFIRTWLALQCRFVDEAATGLAVLGEPDTGPFTPAAAWPEHDVVDPELSATLDRALAERQGVVRELDDQRRSLAYPLIVDDSLYGAVGLSVRGARRPVRELMRELQWGAGWIEVLVRREQARGDAEQRERTALAFDMLAAVLEAEGFQAACSALVTELAMRLDCDPVSVGFVRRKRCTVTAISHAAGFGSRMNLVRDIGAAMDEAVDQRAAVLHPPEPDWEYRVSRAHAELAAAHSATAVLTLPLQCGGEVVGALTLERQPGGRFDEATVELCDAVASIVGPVLEERRRNDRWIGFKLLESMRTQLARLLGPRYFGRKLATVVFVALAWFFSVATEVYRVTSPAVLEGQIQRTLVAPFDGFVATEHARAGEVVREGDVLATLDDRDLTLERLRWATSRRQRLTEYDRALAQRDRAEANVIQAQIAQADAQLGLIDEQLDRTRIRAPFDGVVVEGDLSQAVGAAVARGEELFEIAPLDAYRVVLEVDESDVSDLQEGQTGVLRLASIPESPQSYRIERITPVAEQAEGRNFFRVEASLADVSARVRPGMEGIAKTDVEERLLIWIWTRKLVDWVRITVWRWSP